MAYRARTDTDIQIDIPTDRKVKTEAPKIMYKDQLSTYCDNQLQRFNFQTTILKSS